jgi:hypothetical protein
MSKLILELKVENVFRAKDFTDKKSGEIKPGKWKIQTFDKVETEQGEQIKLIDVSVPDEVAFSLKDKVGEIVSLEVGTYVNNGRVGFYGI